MREDLTFIWFGIIAFLLGSSCIDEYVQEPESQQAGVLVIEGTITGDSLVTVYVSRTVRMDQTATTGGVEHGAEVRILCSDGTQSGAGTEVEGGEYAVPYHALDMAKSYCLQVKTGGKTYQSEFMQPMQTPPIDSLYWYKEDRKAPVDIFLSTHDPSNQAKYYMWTFVEDWEFRATYPTTQYAVAKGWKDADFYDYGTDTIPNPYYYCWKQQVSTDILLISTEKLSTSIVKDFPLHTFPCTDTRIENLYCISVTQKVLNQDTYQYYENKRKLLEDMGSIFSPMPSELKGNITCLENPEEQVIGFIDVANTQLKRLFINNETEGVYYDIEYNHCGIYSLGQLSPPGDAPLTPKDALNQGYRWVHNVVKGSIQEGWSPGECVDCTINGSKNKPDFWPNDHE